MTLPLHRRVTSSSSPAFPDVLDELFGPKLSFQERLTLLDPYVEPLLWAIITHIDVKTFQSIMSSKRPARELVLHLRANADKTELHDAFRAAFSTHPSLGQIVAVPDGQSRTDKQSRLPAAPTSSDLLTYRELLRPAAERSKSRTLPFTEIKHPDQWETEVLRVFRDHAPPLVVVFCDLLTPLPEDYVAEMSRLAQECRGSPENRPQAKFVKTAMPAIRERAESILDEPIREFPTTLIIFPPSPDAPSRTRKRPGYRRVNGPDVRIIRKRLFGKRQPSPPPTPISSSDRSAAGAYMTADLISNPNTDSTDADKPSVMSPNPQPLVEDKVVEGKGDGSPAIEETSKRDTSQVQRSVPQILIPVSQSRRDAFLSPDVVLQWLSCADTK